VCDRARVSGLILWAATDDCHAEGIDDEFLAHVVIDRPADNEA
jgi:hypothetical protein